MKNRQIDHISNIMSKRCGIFTENFTIFFEYTWETWNVPEFEYDKFQKKILMQYFYRNN